MARRPRVPVPYEIPEEEPYTPAALQRIAAALGVTLSLKLRGVLLEMARRAQADLAADAAQPLPAGEAQRYRLIETQTRALQHTLSALTDTERDHWQSRVTRPLFLDEVVEPLLLHLEVVRVLAAEAQAAVPTGKPGRPYAGWPSYDCLRRVRDIYEQHTGKKATRIWDAGQWRRKPGDFLPFVEACLSPLDPDNSFDKKPNALAMRIDKAFKAWPGEEICTGTATDAATGTG